MDRRGGTGSGPARFRGNVLRNCVKVFPRSHLHAAVQVICAVWSRANPLDTPTVPGSRHHVPVYMDVQAGASVAESSNCSACCHL